MPQDNSKAQKMAKQDQRTQLSEEQLNQVSGGSQSTGAGAGKVTFNPFSITRKIDRASPIFF
jgi:bacteriocin-like protein